MSGDDHCFVEFAVDNADRFVALCSVFEAIKHDKEAGAFRDDADWLEFFDDEALSQFWWPTSAERNQYMVKWQTAPLDQRWQDPTLAAPSWEFESLFMAFKDGEYQLLSCHLIGNDRARLEFDAHSYPYGGTDCMHMLIKAFGFRAVAEDDGTDYYTYHESTDA